jgi:endonuclease/exonuclease/phosphatase family metal-dependent hydrolase
MKKIYKILFFALSISAALVILFSALIWFTTYHPDDREFVNVYSRGEAPVLQPGQSLRIMTWNIQYLAGKNYVFFYDLFDGSGPDERPSSKDITYTLNEVARVIREESPDIILLQEVDCWAKRTDYRDQLSDIMNKLPQDYCCHASAWYWKAFFVPHPRIMGSVGMKLAIISKYRISGAIRHQLPVIPDNIFVKQFNFKRAVLEARLPVSGQKDFIAMSTHLDAFAQGSNTMERQVVKVRRLLHGLSSQGYSWVIGGDFNLLPLGGAYDRLGRNQQKYYKPQTELAPFFDEFLAVPSAGEAGSDSSGQFYTHFPNDPEVYEPDRTIDYLFFSRGMEIGEHYVRQNDTRSISDHFPVMAEIKLK